MDKRKIDLILGLLDEHYGAEPVCYLDYSTPWQLLFATILSAQCTDARVNIVTKELFLKYPTLEGFANADIVDVERLVFSTGFYKAKAQNLINSANILIDKFKGEMPKEIENLLLLPGVGRKTANVVRGHIFNMPCIVVDTHVKRISNKLGLTKNNDPEKIEIDLMRILPKKNWIRYNTQSIAHGRKICKSPKPRCKECFLYDHCIGKID